MSNLGLLLKNSFNILVGKTRGKKQRRTTIEASAILIVGMIAILALYSYEAWIMFDMPAAGLSERLPLFHACTTTFAVLVILGIMRSSGKSSNDADLLLSLPIKKRDIVISKTASKYLFDFYFVALLFLPYLIIFQIRYRFDLAILISGIILTFLLPLFSVGLSYIFDFLVSRIFNKFRLGQMFKSIIIVLIFIVVLGLMLIVTSTYGTITSFEGYYERRPVSNLILKFLFDHKALEIMVVCCMTIIPFVVGLMLYAKDFGKSFSSFSAKNKVLKFSNPSSPAKLLFKKELYNYANTTAYIINTIIGAIMILAVGIFLIISGVGGLEDLFQVSIPVDVLVAFVVLAFCGASATSFISASSVSLEGKNIDFLKVVPIDSKKVFWSKILVHFAVMEPFVICSSVLTWIALKLTFENFLILLLLPTLHVSIMAVSGVFINLRYPNFDWEDEAKVVKQSMSSLISMLLGFVLTVALFGIYELFYKTLTIMQIGWICVGVYALFLGLFYVLTFNVGKKLFEKI